MAKTRIPVAVLGATGLVGQRLVARLAEHPWFELKVITASSAREGQTLGEAVIGREPVPLPASVRGLVLAATDGPEAATCDLVFSAVDAQTARNREPELAAAGCVVVSNARAHRLSPLVPLVVPEVNPDHLDRMPTRGGTIVCNPNCAAIGIALAVKPLADAFGLRAIHAVTYQAISGAGNQGVQGGDIHRNVIPHIAAEEPQIEAELPRILGRPGRPLEIPVGTTATRVDVADGHLACISLGLVADTDESEILDVWSCFRGEPQQLELPSAPRFPLVVVEDPYHPQPLLHRDLEGGMTATVGRLRRCPIVGWKFVTLSHNVERGAAGGSILLAELVVSRRGYST